MRDALLPKSHTAFVLALAVTASGCAGFREGSGLQAAQGRMMRVNNGPGADRLQIEADFDVNIANVVQQSGYPDYILVESGEVVRLYYISEDRVFVCTRGGWNPQSVTSVQSPIPENASVLMTEADRSRLAEDRRAAREAALATQSAAKQAAADAELHRAETELAAAKARAEALQIARNAPVQPAVKSKASRPQTAQSVSVRDGRDASGSIHGASTVTPIAETSAPEPTLTPFPTPQTSPIAIETPTAPTEPTAEVSDRVAPVDLNSPIPSAERPRTPSKVLSMMELAFVGSPPQAALQPLLDRAMTLYGLEINENNYSRAGNTLLTIRKQTAVPELQILTYMVSSPVPPGGMNFAQAAAAAASSIRAGSGEIPATPQVREH